MRKFRAGLSLVTGSPAAGDSSKVCRGIQLTVVYFDFADQAKGVGGVYLPNGREGFGAKRPPGGG